MTKKDKELLNRGRWCLALYSALSIHEDNKERDTAEMLLEGVEPINKMSKKEVINELAYNVIPDYNPKKQKYSLNNLVEEAEAELDIRR